MTTNVPIDLQETNRLDTQFLEGTIGFAVRICQIRIFDDFIERLSRLNIRPAEFSILSLIADNPGCRPSQIAEYLSIKRPNFVPLLVALEERDLVMRRQNEIDRRSQNCS